MRVHVEILPITAQGFVVLVKLLKPTLAFRGESFGRQTFLPNAFNVSAGLQVLQGGFTALHKCNRLLLRCGSQGPLTAIAALRQ